MEIIQILKSTKNQDQYSTHPWIQLQFKDL